MRTGDFKGSMQLYSIGFRVQGSGFRVLGQFRVQGSGYGV